MRRPAFLILGVFGLVFLPSCASHDEQTRATIEAGGTVPWNRPEKWEGPGVLGSQMSSMQGGY
jgi:hypothetical protein